MKIAILVGGWDPIYPPKNAGSIRIIEVAKYLSQKHKVDVISISKRNNYVKINDNLNLYEVCILSEKFSIYKWLWYSFFLFPKNPFEILRSLLFKNYLLKHFKLEEYDLFILEYANLGSIYSFLKKYMKPIITEQHNVDYVALERHLSALYFPLPKLIKKILVNNRKRYEISLLKNSNIVICVSEEDKKIFEKDGIKRIYVVENGCNFEKIDGISKEYARRRLLKIYKLPSNTKIGLFVGSYDYYPNLQAAKIIVDLIAPELPDHVFFLIGKNPPTIKTPRNVIFTGFVNDLNVYLMGADYALSPLLSGSGTKMKVIDYLSAGLPLIATSISCEGLPLKNGFNCIISDDIKDYPNLIVDLLNNRTLYKKLSKNAIKVAKKYFWKYILQKYDEVIRYAIS